MRSWNSALKLVLVRSARSTHSSPRTLRRVFIPFSYAVLPMGVLSSGKVGSEGGEELVHGRLHRVGLAASGLAVGCEVFLHAGGVDHQRGCDGCEEIEARAERPRELPNDASLGLPAPQGAV